VSSDGLSDVVDDTKTRDPCRREVRWQRGL
jgi:hypothetical protein